MPNFYPSTCGQDGRASGTYCGNTRVGCLMGGDDMNLMDECGGALLDN